MTDSTTYDTISARATTSISLCMRTLQSGFFLQDLSAY